MTTIEIIHLILGSSGLITAATIFFKCGKIVKSVESLEKKIDDIASDVKDLKKEVHDIDKRLAVLEAETVVFNMIPEPNRRSEAATRRHAKRREERQLAAIEGR